LIDHRGETMSVLHSGTAGHVHATQRWHHGHHFLGVHHRRNERKVWLVIGLTTVMMVGEIVAGWLLGSMALLADGWHMSTHAGALGIAGLAYRYARNHLKDPRFAFGTGKLGDLAAFTSAIILAFIAVLIVAESAQRLVAPIAIAFTEAIPIAILGLVVNLVSAWLLGPEEAELEDHAATHAHQGHGHGHGHSHGHDNAMRSAYVHVLADAATSVLAIVGLLAGLYLGWVWLDPVVGMVGALVIASWAYTLIRAAGGVLLDLTPDPDLGAAIRAAIEIAGDRITDLHLWRVGPGHCGAIIAVVSEQPQVPAHYKNLLSGIAGLSHVTVEVQPCDDDCLRTGVAAATPIS
jgi:cation diffusion facilitator family transporter